ncbi:M20 family metallo-hydrolase [Clostridium sp. 19966]|uniref:M20 family metallo-hydrolase n=1 Tax=Clostridium sp. 19966 TaxID=2768166 RepID=UPI0028DE0B2E|nr:M20 family metallo-hydrolase [Clostridium sp. 19966]MDT8718842.1 M20 family metallo-hydrolase [Clostridium sp. 19966]
MQYKDEAKALNIKVNKKRLENNLQALAEFGKNQNGGIDRNFGSEADFHARKWLIEMWKKELGAEAYIDPIANLWVRLQGSEALKPIVLGSHHDSVKNGGRFDGALGILLASEVLKRIKEEGLSLRHPLAIVSFSAEEPNPFNISTMGSRVSVGKVTKKQLKEAFDVNTKEKLEDAIKFVGGDVEKLENRLLNEGDLSAFIECHIEQGRNLFDKGLSLAVVNKVTGIYREKVKVKGESNHAGTTKMEFRHDALMAASELCLAFEKIIKSFNRPDVVGTIGWFNIEPNSANIIPGEANLIVEIRTPNSDIKEDIINKLTQCVEEIIRKREVELQREVILNQPEVTFDETVINALKKASEAINEEFMELVSMAGHDSVHMSDITRTGMLFVKSIDGKSHCPEEFTNIEDIEKAGNALLEAVLILDKELD